MVNRDTIGAANGVRLGSVFKGSRCLRQVVVEPNGTGGYEVLLAFEGKKPRRAVAGVKPTRHRQCFYLGWKSKTVMHMYPPRNAVNGGNCSSWPSEELDGKLVYVKSGV